mmetsp:Transcript_73708/g.142549  ORF Transcript_73708/g.142549 Transcript_73708/m.142549 type:complete len:234 (+) Transcript_73708:324-1025(+)
MICASVPLSVQCSEITGSMDRLLLCRVACLWHRRNLPRRLLFGRCLGLCVPVGDSMGDAISNRENAAITPQHPLPHHHLQILVDHDPATTPGTFVAQDRLWHEVVGTLWACDNVCFVRSTWQPNLLPVNSTIFVIFCAIHSFDVSASHILFTVCRRLIGKGIQALGQDVCECNGQPREVVPEIACPLYAHEASTNYQHLGLSLVELRQAVMLLQNAPSSPLQKSLIQMPHFTN